MRKTKWSKLNLKFHGSALVVLLAVAMVSFYSLGSAQSTSGNPQSTSSETKEWKTYENSSYGFAVSYPSGWKTTEFPDGGVALVPKGNAGGVKIIIEEIEKRKTLPKYLKEIDTIVDPPSVEVIRKKTIRVGRIKAIQRIENWTYAGIKTVVTYLKKKGNIYTFQLETKGSEYTDEEKSVYDKILKSFKFNYSLRGSPKKRF